METKTIWIVLGMFIILLFMLLYYYFNRRIQFQQLSIDSLQHQILEQQKTIEQHEHLFQQLVTPSMTSSSMHYRPSSIRTPTSSPLHHNVQTQHISTTPMMSSNIPSLLPMMGSLLNVFNSTTNTVPSYEDNEDDIIVVEQNCTASLPTTSDLEEELVHELNELKEPSSSAPVYEKEDDDEDEK